MPNIESAKKALRQNKKRTILNLTKKRKIKELVKKLEKSLVASEKSAGEKLLQQLHKALDKAGKTNTIHPNKASRLKSRAQKKFNALKK
ncbi:MAG: 30S ribosomal protein S20 [Candidatus Kerfeldbacteria bacterium RIFOXYA2_FULL_38_24]|uniref:Small ribosomal subunit protein bS20 n=1 Tax=Candidatus Kerfeldbacteria bacterium RIFOXYB2_FULL_38_14 TaxID=1798547 RepID=A0A1G2BH57_9BACT|nr:MAG: 30S ribosomal protein S20 [Candidatus Kerfeldbacteria bacterium RIFOXYB2_FULL_38_14]OGY88201.1 MAG: 30S ribosomal protein S20 [Candidatus Kerfeldbacteria bacterium RIFOXYA2_FULL_38_24]OGY89221.1 MAG: 30S ribosomal protein S20 [Candidatus Kerfeldbacteria bacterium RIFOXYC2_FULL_38_9]